MPGLFPLEFGLSAGKEAVANYFGDGSDGPVTITGDTTVAVVSNVAVRNYTTLTINSSVNLTAASPCRALLIYCTGNCTINGFLHMDAKGVDYTSEALDVSRWTSPGNGSGAPADPNFPSEANQLTAGFSPGTFTKYQSAQPGAPAGTPGVTDQTGGGGPAATPGSAGRAGGGGIGTPGGPGAPGECPGGENPPQPTAGGEGGTGNTSPGGVIFLIVGGDLTIGASGRISADGGNGSAGTPGGGCTAQPGGTGGGSGGGRVIVVYAGALINNGVIRASGGNSAGNGTTTTQQILP
jgi:hypothetical protein